MTKKTERKVSVSGKPKHSLDANRSDGNKNARSAATVRRLKMYNTRPKRDRKGKVLKHELQSKELPDTRIQPDRRWFGTFRLSFLFRWVRGCYHGHIQSFFELVPCLHLCPCSLFYELVLLMLSCSMLIRF